MFIQSLRLLRRLIICPLHRTFSAPKPALCFSKNRVTRIRFFYFSDIHSRDRSTPHLTKLADKFSFQNIYHFFRFYYYSLFPSKRKKNLMFMLQLKFIMCIERAKNSIVGHFSTLIDPHQTRNVKK